MASLIEKQVNSFLQEIQRVAGVQHVFVCDRQGILLGARSESTVESAVLDRIGVMVMQIVGAMEKHSGKTAEIEAQFEHGTIVIRDLGNALAVIVCTSKVNWSLLRIALNVVVTKFTQDANLQKALAQIVPFAQVLQVMGIFTDTLLEEFGDRGVGRDPLLQAIEPGLGKLKVKYPFFQDVTVANGRIDLSSLSQPLGAPKEIVQAWGDLVMEICERAVDKMGEPAVVKRYRDAGSRVYRQYKKEFQAMDLESVIPTIDLPIGF